MDEELRAILIILTPLLCVVVWKLVTTTRSNPRNLPYPPGPKPLPIVGNLYELPKDPTWLGYKSLSEKFGDVVFLRSFGQPILILGSAQAATDLLHQRSAIYSDRMEAPVVSLVGWDWNIAFMPYNASWRAHRRIFQEYFRSSVLGHYAVTQEQQMLKFLRSLLEQPENFADLIHLWFGATLFKIVYDIDVDDLSNKYLRNAETAVKALSEAVIPGRFWVDLVPVLKYVPEWMPGAEFKKKAAQWKPLTIASNELPFQTARSAWVGNVYLNLPVNFTCFQSKDKIPVCVVDRMLLRFNEHPDQIDETVLMNVAGIAFAAGSDTSLSTVESFFLAMAMYPDIQRRAQEELDNVVGPDKLPRSDDRPSLPYIEAMMRETFRWQPVVPLGVAHKSIADDEYRGYLIPKGTVVIANQWAILHDPDTYPHPERFNPDRYLKDGKLDHVAADATNVGFGFGRRMCPGRYFAEHSVSLFFASVLHVFDISPPLDERGQPVQLEPRMTSGGISHPEPFKCTIKPRSSARATLLSERSKN